MIQEDKKILIKDLCARLPYGVICEGKYSDAEYDIDGGIEMFDVRGVLEAIFIDEMIIISYNCDIETVKPYLRPMSSMTEKEDKEYRNIDNRSYSCPINYAHIPASDRIDWLNAHHFDYRGLIEKGLAIAVTEENNPYKS